MVKTVDGEAVKGTLPVGAKKLYFQNVGANPCLITFQNREGDETLELQPNAILNLEYNGEAYPALAYDASYNALNTHLQIVAVY